MLLTVNNLHGQSSVDRDFTGGRHDNFRARGYSSRERRSIHVSMILVYILRTGNDINRIELSILLNTGKLDKRQYPGLYGNGDT